MATPPYPEDEHSRQAYVDQLGLLEEGADEVFEEILAAATSYFQTPIALISILDHQRQWFRASIGLDIRQTPRRDSFCAYAILGREYSRWPTPPSTRASGTTPMCKANRASASTPGLRWPPRKVSTSAASASSTGNHAGRWPSGTSPCSSTSPGW